MNIWETMTGSDLTRECKAFDARAEALPADYRAAWEQIKAHLFPYGDFTGRKLMPILDSALGLLEEAAADLERTVGDRPSHLARDLFADAIGVLDAIVRHAPADRGALGDRHALPVFLCGGCVLEHLSELVVGRERTLGEDGAVDGGDGFLDSVRHEEQ